MKWLKRIALPAGIILGLMVVGFGIAFAAGSLIVSFDSKTSVTGSVHIIAPEPTAGDIVFEVPELTLYAGQPNVGNVTLTVHNNSYHALTVDYMTFDNSKLSGGTIELADSNISGSIAPAGGIQEILLFYNFSGISQGDYEWGATIKYDY